MTDKNKEHECCGGHGHENEEHECCGGHGHENEEHECCGGHGHGHGHGHSHEDDDCCGGDCGCHGDGEYQMIQLSLEDGREVSAAVLDIFELNNKEYVALLPVDEENVLLYEFKEDEEGVDLINIDSEEEFQAVSDYFMSMMEFDEEDEE